MGHTGDGKTALLQAVARGAAKSGVKVLQVLMEDPARRCADRELAQLTGMASHRIGRLDEGLHDLGGRLADAATEAEDWAKNILVVNGDAEPDQLLELVDRMPDVGLIQIDYIQRFTDGEESLEAICGRFSREMGHRAERLNAAVMLGCQVRSTVADRGRIHFERTGNVEGFIPGRGDAMWSRRMEQFVRAIWVVFREGRWKKELGLQAEDNEVLLKIVKASYGPEGAVKLTWDGARTKIG